MNQNNELLLEKITTHLASYGSVLIAYSGGVDSSLLAVIASRTPGLKMLAVLAGSPPLPRRGDGGGEPGRAAAHNQNLDII